MDWIKRNLYFLIGGAVALALMGMAGYYLYSKWSLNNEELEKLNQDYAELAQLNNADPHPGSGQINNIKLAEEQAQQVEAVIEKARSVFQPIPPIPQIAPPPDAPTNGEPVTVKISDRDFSAALSRTIDYLQKTATNSSVVLPPNYLFSFSAQNARVSFDPGSPDRLAVQLGEVKTICDVLFAAKVNSIDNIRRERVSKDDSTGGNLSDYFEKKSVTNELAVLTPYEVTFRCFSPELAAVLAGFASSPHGIIVKGLNVEPAPAVATQTEEPMSPMYTGPMYVPSAGAGTDGQSGASAAAFARRYGLGAGARAGGRYGAGPQTPVAPTTPQPMYVPQATVQPARTGPQTALDEKQIKVTLTLSIVKLLPKQEAAS